MSFLTSSPAPASTRAGGEKVGLLAAALRVEDNLVAARERGIDLGGLAAYVHSCRVHRNDVIAGADGGIVATGAVAPGGSLDLVGNKVSTTGGAVVAGADASIEANVVNARGGGPGADGIVVAPGTIAVSPGNVRIAGNRVHDRAGTGIALRTAVRTLRLDHNVLERVGSGFAVEARGAAERRAVHDNEVLDVATAADAAPGRAIGILVARSGSVTVEGNTVARVAPDLVEGRLRGGIVVLACEDVRVTGNVVDEIGPREGYVGSRSGSPWSDRSTGSRRATTRSASAPSGSSRPTARGTPC